MKNEPLSDSWRNLAEIHAAPQWLWSGLVKALERQRSMEWKDQWKAERDKPVKVQTPADYEAAKACHFFGERAGKFPRPLNKSVTNP